MAKHRRRHRPQRDGVIGSALRPVGWSTLLGAVMATTAVTPAFAAPPVTAYAEPGIPDQVPDAGARPSLTAPLQLPGASPTTTPLAPANPGAGLGPLALRITALETEVAGLGEQLKALGLERQQAQTEIDTLSTALTTATAALASAEKAAKSALEHAYKRAVGLPPGAIDSELHALGGLSRLREERPPTSESAQAVQLKRAQEAERAARLAHSQAIIRRQELETRYTGLQTTFKQRQRALLDLRRSNASELAAIEREREAQEQRLGAGYVGGDTVAGTQAHPKAKAALRFALAQLGEAYVWGAEGPNTWDCSGLMWGAYRSVGETLPRVAADQFQGTKSRQVARTALLPGDLLFFSTSSTDASQIHHVGMYVGNGKMVHAPTSNDVVKISTVWWSHYFGATRVFGAVKAAKPSTPPGQTTPKPKPKPITPKPPTTPDPDPTTPGAGPTTPGPGPTTPDPGPTTPGGEPSTPPNPPSSSPSTPANPPEPVRPTDTAGPSASASPTASGGAQATADGSPDATG